MKILNDFITNSSSTSFTIFYKKFPEIREEIYEEYPFLKQYIKIVNEVLKGNNVISNIEEYNEYIMDTYSYNDNVTLDELLNEDEWLKVRYDDTFQKIKEGYNLIIKELDYHEDAVISILENLHDGENFIVREDR